MAPHHAEVVRALFHISQALGLRSVPLTAQGALGGVLALGNNRNNVRQAGQKSTQNR